ncbi:MAG: HAD family hydrolase [Deltaproteobacteria bacterium]
MLFLKNSSGKAADGGIALEGLIFDLDGTLIDSVGIYYVMMETVFEELSWPPVSREVMRKAIKDGGFDWDLVLPSGTGRTTEDLIASAREVIREMYPRVFEDEVDLVPGAENLLKRLHERNVKLGLVTSTLERFIEFKLIPLKKRRLRELFQSVITLDDVKNRKPSGDPLLECARRLGAHPEKCAYVGDATVDIVAGKAAGMRTIAVLTGVDDYEALEEEDPDLILDSVAQLTERLNL